MIQMKHARYLIAASLASAVLGIAVWQAAAQQAPNPFPLAAPAGRDSNAKAVAPTGLAGGLAPYLVGSLVWGVGLSLGGPTGYAINPARDFGPRLMHAVLPIAGKGGSDWGYASIPIVGPLVGGAIAGFVLRGLGI